MSSQRILQPVEEQQLYQHCESRILKTMIKTCLYHGLRGMELVTLKNKHWKNQQIDIREKNTKSQAGDRKIPTPKHITPLLREWTSQFDGRETYIFPSPRGKDRHISKRWFSKSLKNLCFEAGIYPDTVTKENLSDKLEYEERIVPHTLRHTYASRLHNKGVDLKTISDLLGHENIDTTADIYSHTSKKQKRKAVNKLTD